MKLSEELQEEYDNDLERLGDDFKVWAERARVLEEKAEKWDNYIAYEIGKDLASDVEFTAKLEGSRNKYGCTTSYMGYAEGDTVKFVDGFEFEEAVIDEIAYWPEIPIIHLKLPGGRYIMPMEWGVFESIVKKEEKWK